MTWKNNGGIYEVEATVVKSPVELRREMAELTERIEAEKLRRSNKKASA